MVGGGGWRWRLVEMVTVDGGGGGWWRWCWLVEEVVVDGGGSYLYTCMVLASCFDSVMTLESSVSDTYPVSPMYFRGSTNSGFADRAIMLRGEKRDFQSSLWN